MLNNKKNIFIYIGIFIAATLISLGFGNLMHTFGTFGGDSPYYVSQAEEILTHGLQYYFDHIATPYYWGYPTFLAVCIAIVGENWAAVALIQIFLSALSMIFLFCVVNDVLEYPILSMLLVLFYKLIWDTSIWDGRIYSDSLGMTLECMTLYFFYVGMRDRRKKDYALFVIFAILFFMTRTNSVSLLIVLVAALLARIPGKGKWIICGIIVAAALIGMFVAGEGADLGLGARVEYYVNYFRQGEIVHHRPEYDYHIPEGHTGSPLFLLDIVLMLLLKAKYYWSIYFSEYSTVHIAICFVTILPVFLVTLFSVVCIIKDKQKQLYPFVAGIISYSFIQVCTEVDYDLRYRAPVFLLCIICSGYGIKIIYLQLRRWMERKRWITCGK